MTAKQVQIRRDSATNLNAAVPASGEIGYDTTNKRLRVGDGSTSGGIILPNSTDVQNQTFLYASAGGTADALTLTVSPVPSAYVTGQRFSFKATATNTTTTPTINVNSLGAKTFRKKSSSGASTLAVGDIQNGVIYSCIYDGTYMQLEAVDISTNVTGGLTQIATSTPTGVATVEFNNIPQTYRGLILTWTGISCATNTRALQVQADTNATFSVSGINVNAHQIRGTTVSDVSSTELFTATTQTSAQTSDGVIVIHGYQNGAGAFYNGWSNDGNGTGYQTFNGTFVSTKTIITSAIQSLKLLWNGSGNFDAGTIKLYGIN